MKAFGISNSSYIRRPLLGNSRASSVMEVRDVPAASLLFSAGALYRHGLSHLFGQSFRL